MVLPTKLPEHGWLIEFPSQVCLGKGEGLATVPFTHEGAIRFKRKQDAENMLTALRELEVFGMKDWLKDCVVTEHQWG